MGKPTLSCDRQSCVLCPSCILQEVAAYLELSGGKALVRLEPEVQRCLLARAHKPLLLLQYSHHSVRHSLECKYDLPVCHPYQAATESTHSEPLLHLRHPTSTQSSMLAKLCRSCLFRCPHGRRLYVAYDCFPCGRYLSRKVLKVLAEGLRIVQRACQGRDVDCRGRSIVHPHHCLDLRRQHTSSCSVPPITHSHEVMRLLCAAMFIATASCTSTTAFTCTDGTYPCAASLLSDS